MSTDPLSVTIKLCRHCVETSFVIFSVAHAVVLNPRAIELAIGLGLHRVDFQPFAKRVNHDAKALAQKDNEVNV